MEHEAMGWMKTLGVSAVLGMTVALAVACGGDSKKDTTPENGETAAAPTATSDAGAAAPTPTEDDGSSDGPAASASPYDSYHYVVTIKMEVEGEESGFIGGDVEGDYVAPHSHAWRQTFEFGGLSFDESFVIIGEDAWYREGEGGWEVKSADDPVIVEGTDLTSADPEFLVDASFIDDIRGFDSTTEEKNGVSTRKYEFSKDQFAELSELLGEDLLGDTSVEDLDDFSMVVWIDEETDALIAADMRATTTRGAAGDLPFDVPEDGRIAVRTTIDVTRVNDDSIAIEPPI